ncbi:MAG: hypothetical protein ACRERU_08140 [Methylococcales bacterium]
MSNTDNSPSGLTKRMTRTVIGFDLGGERVIVSSIRPDRANALTSLKLFRAGQRISQ